VHLSAVTAAAGGGVSACDSQCGKMEHLQQFAGKNRSCKNGLARRRQKILLRHQLQHEVERQRQALQAMHGMYKQQQQQKRPVEQDHNKDAFWDSPS
jgi:cell shape-determining protein MreC